MSDQRLTWLLDWPTSHRGRLARAVLKAKPEYFVVNEDLDASLLSGGGEHLYLQLQKCGDNTEYVGRQLAAMAGCRHFDVGFCGLKDRNAVTTQWFSLYLPGREPQDDELVARINESWPVLAKTRHSAKLRRGDHRGNRFAITLTEVEGDPAAIDEALRFLAKQGAPNYFGPQRFGHQGGNLDRAIGLQSRKLADRRRRGKSREAARDGMYFSAARSWLFNEILGQRVADGTWTIVLDGEPDTTVPPQPTGPLWGDGGTTAQSMQGNLERDVAGRSPEVLAVFANTRMRPERRSLVMLPGDFQWQWPTPGQLVLSFWLPPGQFATTLLADVFELREPQIQDSGLAEPA